MATDKTRITVEALVDAPAERVWEFWNGPEHITKWCSATEEWHTPRSENDVRVGGKFSSRMEAKDGSMGFDFAGVYDEVRPNERLAYTMGDDRKVEISFTKQGDATQVTETFDAEETNPVEMQQGGWQAILNNFKKYAEENK